MMDGRHRVLVVEDSETQALKRSPGMSACASTDSSRRYRRSSPIVVFESARFQRTSRRTTTSCAVRASR